MDIHPGSSGHQTHQSMGEMSAAHVPVHHANKGDKMFKLQKQMVMWLVIAILLIAAAGTTLFYVKKYHDSQAQVKKLSSNPTITAQQQTQDLINKVAKLTVLPSGEAPTVATVTDITKLTGQPFFANAKNGDKVLIYTQAKEAFLYRPSTNKLINIAPVNLGNGSSSSTTGTSTTTNTTTKK